MITPVLPLKTPRLRRPETVPTGLKVSVGKSLRPAIQRIAQELNPEKIVLFGSYAYGNPNPDSDVDLLVIPQGPELGGIPFAAAATLPGRHSGQNAP